MEIADEAISSKKFWGYVTMADLVGWTLLVLSGWFDDCSCHEEIPTHADCTRRERREYFRNRVKMRCIMCCRRAPEMAAGRLLELVSQLFRWSANALQMELGLLGCTPNETTEITLEFEAARRHVWVMTIIKQSYMTTIPWLLLGIGHWSLDIARRLGRACLQKRPLGPVLETDHWLVVLLLLTPWIRALLCELGRYRKY